MFNFLTMFVDTKKKQKKNFAYWGSRLQLTAKEQNKQK